MDVDVDMDMDSSVDRGDQPESLLVVCLRVCVG